MHFSDYPYKFDFKYNCMLSFQKMFDSFLLIFFAILTQKNHTNTLFGVISGAVYVTPCNAWLYCIRVSCTNRYMVVGP